MTDPANQPPGKLEDLRAQVDALDSQVLTLLARRMATVAEIARTKRAQGLKVKDPGRESQVLRTRRAEAEARGLSPELIESLFRLIMWASRDYQAALRAEVPLTVEPKSVAIVGGAGGIGRRMAQLFEDLGHRVLIADLATELTPSAAARQADVTLICVPIGVTEQVIREVGPHVPKHGLLADVTSIKTAPMRAMLEATEASVLGTHPMFGPGVHSLQGQRLVMCRGRGDAWHDWAKATFGARGLTITEASPEEHDRAMASVQVLTHYQTQVLGLTLARLGAPLAESLKFTSPAYLMELYVAARHFGQDPLLYGPIEMTNPLAAQVTETFNAAAEAVSRMILEHDQAAFSAMFAEVRAFFGAFAEEANEQSKFMMDRLVERS